MNSSVLLVHFLSVSFWRRFFDQLSSRLLEDFAFEQRSRVFLEWGTRDTGSLCANVCNQARFAPTSGGSRRLLRFEILSSTGLRIYLF